MAVGGEEVMSRGEFDQWFAHQSVLREGASFHDELRRELARRRGLGNFRPAAVKKKKRPPKMARSSSLREFLYGRFWPVHAGSEVDFGFL